MHDIDRLAQRLLGKPYETLDAATKKVARHVADGTRIARNVSHDAEAQATRGQRAADAVARFGGSWTFIGLFAAVMIGWVILNSLILVRYGSSFDPYPYILLNLFLSMLASIQAPIILMSQNRHAEKDRLDAEHDYEVNLKAELEIMLLHEKVDHLREVQWGELLAMQKEQLAVLAQLIAVRPVSPSNVEQQGGLSSAVLVWSLLPQEARVSTRAASCHDQAEQKPLILAPRSRRQSPQS